MSISIIIPAYNEEASIAQLVEHLFKHKNEAVSEVIVVDGLSDDRTKELAERAGAKVFQCTKRCRASQMNLGAQHASGNLLYFVHADAFPPTTYANDILQSVAEGNAIGCYRFKFDSDRRMLKINSYFTRFDRIMCRGGDQTLYVDRKLFDELGGYREDYCIMEDYDFIIRARKRARFRIMKKDVVVSARKYDNNSYLRVNFANLTVFMMFFMGYKPERMRSTYQRLIQHPKA